MTVQKLRAALSAFPDDLEVFTKKEEVFGNVGCVNSIKEDKYSFFGDEFPCVIISDRSGKEET